jgi:ribosomal protein S12 methylthiotransferase accessory factor
MIAALSPPLRRAVSSYTGIVRTLEECLAASDEPGLFRATCEVARSDALLGLPLDHLGGIGGAGATRAEAAAAAVGEALERYSATFVPRERLIVGTADELGSVAVDPERFALFSGAQHERPGFPFRPFTRSTRVSWIEGWSLPEREPALLPAELVLLGNAADGMPIGYATSSGAACAETLEEALVRGLCELLERDAFMIVWAARLTLPLLDWCGNEEMQALDARFFAPTGLEYSAVDLSPVHGVPSVLGVVRAPGGVPGALGIGAGTARTIERAWFKALSEAFAVRAAGAKLALLDEPAYDEHGSNVRSFDDHIRFYADHERATVTRFLDSGELVTSASAVAPLPGDAVAALCERVRAAGSCAYAVDVTSPDVRELGLVVTRVVAPELCALDVAHSARFLGGRRLHDAPVALGLREEALAEAHVNPYPHPFP